MAFEWLDDIAKVAFPLYGAQVLAGEMIGGALFSSPEVAPINVTPPPPVPDITDETIQKARLAAIRRQVMGGGLSSMFITGPLGDLSSPGSTKPRAGGY